MRLVLPALLLFLSSCASTPARPPSPQDQTSGLTNGTTWVQRSAEYVALTTQIYRQATERVEAAAAARRPGTWAVVADADETVLDNVVYQVERERAGLGFTPESWNAWVRRREAVPVPGAAAFLSRVRALGGRIAIVTNRLQSECDDTEAVFRVHRLAYDAMLCRPDDQPSDKNPRFARVAAGDIPGATGPLEVVAYVGDNILDFPALSQALRQRGPEAFAPFGVTHFVLPNPMYGSWQR